MNNWALLIVVIWCIFILSGGEGSQKEEGNQVHPGIVCDGCEDSIRGPRYKCLMCPDYDLCKTCEGKGMHVEHDMMKIATPGGMPGFPGFPFGPHGGPPGEPQGSHGPHGPHGVSIQAQCNLFMIATTNRL